MHSVLLIEDNNDLRENMRWALNTTYAVFEADSITTGISQFKEHCPEVVCLDMGLDNIPDGGLGIIDQLLLEKRDAKIIVITANTSDEIGPESVRRGAFDFFNKPIDIDYLKLSIERALRIAHLEGGSNNQSVAGAVMPIDSSKFMVGTSDVIQQVFTLIKRLAQTDVNVLITGESGTGKELCARAIHYYSERRTSNFVPINCGAIPENLMESELFGYIKGAFTGANTDKEGLIESAEGGTLLLDEIGEMPKNMQVKLLRFLEDQLVTRVGGTTAKKANVRIIAATNRSNLADQNSTLRNDLYYRLSEFQIDLPPLRERGEDVIQIARAIIEKNRIKFNRNRLKLSTRGEKVLLSYCWPGNVRELENKLSRASIICTNDSIEPEDLQLDSQRTRLHLNGSYKDARESFEKEYVENLMDKVDGNISEAAKTAGISRPTLYSMLKKYAIG